MKAMAELTGDAITLLSNRCGCMIRDLGLEDLEEKERGPVSRPAAYFIDSDGLVQFHYIGRGAEDRPLLELLKLAGSNMPRQSREISR